MFFKDVQLCHLNYRYTLDRDKFYFNIRNLNKVL